MTNREHFNAIMNRKSDKCGFWHGHASDRDFISKFDTDNDLDLGYKLGDCFAWINIEGLILERRPNDFSVFDVLGGQERHSLSQDGVFADCESVKEVDRFDWPDVSQCDFTKAENLVDEALKRDQAVLSGVWSPFFHVVSDFFGMENYFAKMYTDPDVVHAVTEHVVDFYLKVNKKWFSIIGDRMDAIFFGNDFGTQMDLMISPEKFDEFVMPHFRKITQQAKDSGYKVVLHSCGAIERVIPRLIDAGVDALHPIQARARNMYAENLAEKYGDKLVFIGGVDAQGVLPFGR